MGSPSVQQISAAMAFGWMAAAFVCQPETFAVFMAWADKQPGEKLSDEFTRDRAMQLRDELRHGMMATAMLARGDNRG